MWWTCQARIKVLERLSVALGNRGLLGKMGGAANSAVSNQLEEAVSKELSQMVGEGSRAEEEDDEPFPKDKGEEDAGEGQISSIFEEMIAHSDSVVDILPSLAEDQAETESMSMPLSRKNSCGSDLLAEERRELMRLLEEEEREARERQEDELEAMQYRHGIRGPNGMAKKRMPHQMAKLKQGKMRAAAKADKARRAGGHSVASDIVGEGHAEMEEEGEGRSDEASDGGGSYQSLRRRRGDDDNTTLGSYEEEDEEDEERSLDFITGFCGRDGRPQDQAAQYK